MSKYLVKLKSISKQLKICQNLVLNNNKFLEVDLGLLSTLALTTLSPCVNKRIVLSDSPDITVLIDEILFLRNTPVPPELSILPYDIMFYLPSSLDDSLFDTHLSPYISPRKIILLKNLLGCQAKCDLDETVDITGFALILLCLNEVPIGNISFTSNSIHGALSLPETVTVPAGGILSLLVVADNIENASAMTNFSISLKGYAESSG